MIVSLFLGKLSYAAINAIEGPSLIHTFGFEYYLGTVGVINLCLGSTTIGMAYFSQLFSDYSGEELSGPYKKIMILFGSLSIISLFFTKFIKNDKFEFNKDKENSKENLKSKENKNIENSREGKCQSDGNEDKINQNEDAIMKDSIQN